MKKYGKLLTKISLIVLAVSLFLSLSLSDVIRLNPQLEGVSKAQLVSTAKKATVDEKVSVLIPADELPEAPAATEATMEWSPEGYPELDINGDGEPDGFLLSYEDFAALGGQFLKDKYGAVRQVELEGVHYAQGRVNNKGLLWQQLRFSSRALCALAVVYVPLIVLGAALLAAVTAQYYLPRAILPHEILLCVDTGDCEELSEALTQRAGHKVWVHVPQRGEKSTLADMAVRNAQEEVRRATTAEEKTAYTLEALQKMLNLPQPPRRMESFDISNTGASDIVASMVVYQGAKPLKSAYRRFQIKELTGGHPDDYGSMREVLRRRLQRAADEDEKFLPLPDVFLIDGGVTHADAVREVAEQFGCTVPIFGMVKDDRHRTRALVTPEGREIGIVNQQAVFSLIGQIQEETHRFAITYHHQHHTKSAMRSALDGVPGLGPKRQAELRKHFGTVKAIRAADETALAAVLPQNVDHTLWIRLHEKEST